MFKSASCQYEVNLNFYETKNNERRSQFDFPINKSEVKRANGKLTWMNRFIKIFT